MNLYEALSAKAAACKYPPSELEIRRAQDQIDICIARLAASPTSDHMRDLVAAWTKGVLLVEAEPPKAA